MSPRYTSFTGIALPMLVADDAGGGHCFRGSQWLKPMPFLNEFIACLSEI